MTDKDRSAHKLRSLNKKVIWSVLHSFADGLGYELIDSFECSLLWNKWNEYLVTSLDGWIVLRPKGDTVLTECEDKEDDDLHIPKPLQINCELEIKMPSSKKLLLGLFVKQEIS